MNKKVTAVILSFLFMAASGAPLFADKENIKKALVLLNEGKTKEAIEILNGEIKQDSDSEPLTYLALGMAYIDQGRYGEAQACLENFLKAKPDSVAKAKDSWEKVLLLAHDKDLKELADKHIKQIANSAP